MNENKRNPNLWKIIQATKNKVDGSIIKLAKRNRINYPTEAGNQQQLKINFPETEMQERNKSDSRSTSDKMHNANKEHENTKDVKFAAIGIIGILSFIGLIMFYLYTRDAKSGEDNISSTGSRFFKKPMSAIELLCVGIFILMVSGLIVDVAKTGKI